MAAPPRPVTLNVYDVVPPPPQPADAPASSSSSAGLPTDAVPPSSLVARLNAVGRAAGLGGVFHGGVAVDGKEYAYGYCERGTGIYATQPRQNPLYVFREAVDLGATRLPPDEVAALVRRLRDAWPGDGYDLLRRNCCHFCAELARGLGVGAPPAWLNRLANAGEATAAAAADAAAMARGAAAEVQRLGWEGLSALRRAAAGAGLVGGGGGGAAGGGGAGAGGARGGGGGGGGGPTGTALLRSLAEQDGGLFWGRGAGGAGAAGAAPPAGPAAPAAAGNGGGGPSASRWQQQPKLDDGGGATL